MKRGMDQGREISTSKYISRVIAWVLLLVLGGISAGSSAVISVNIPGYEYGDLDQHDMTVYPTMACGPASVVNGLVYLQTSFPSVYGTRLVPNISYSGLESLGNKLAGPGYMNTDSTNGTWHDELMAGTVRYIQSVAPGSTLFAAQDYWSWTNESRPSWMTYKTPTWNFIYNALVANSDVELLFTYQSGGGHFVTARGLYWNDLNNDGIIQSSEGAQLYFINPWTGANDSTQIWQTSSGAIDTAYSDSWISVAFSLTEVPEPDIAALLLLGMGVAVLIRRRTYSIS